MPNRIIKESICTSDSINALTDFQEAFFYRLVVNCDDYGRMDARPAILKARLYPLREGVTDQDIRSALRALEAVGCAAVYEVEGKPYLRLPSWEAHQQIRAKRSKYPSPAAGPPDPCGQLMADACNCPRNPIQSESESESNPNPDCPEPPAGSGPPVCRLPLNNGEEFLISREQADEWAALYPAVDVAQALNAMRGWCLSNPDRRKTRRGVPAFVNRWLAREQGRTAADKPGDVAWMAKYIRERENG